MELTGNSVAKVNLFLGIKGRDTEGYHLLDTFIQPIRLCDTLIITYPHPTLTLEISYEERLPIMELPSIEENIVMKAVNLFSQKIGEEIKVKIQLIKRIPVAGGLGGGSCDAATTLLLLNKVLGFPLQESDLYKIGIRLGMDVSFFLNPVPSLWTGRGEVFVKSFTPLNFFCILVNPNVKLSTTEVYTQYDVLCSSLSLTEQVSGDNILTHLCLSYERGDIESIQETIYNSLEKPACSLQPLVEEVFIFLKECGIKRPFLSGSGPTVCAIVGSQQDAKEVVERIGKERKEWWCRYVPTYVERK